MNLTVNEAASAQLGWALGQTAYSLGGFNCEVRQFRD